MHATTGSSLQSSYYKPNLNFKTNRSNNEDNITVWFINLIQNILGRFVNP